MEFIGSKQYTKCYLTVVLECFWGFQAQANCSQQKYLFHEQNSLQQHFPPAHIYRSHIFPEQQKAPQYRRIVVCWKDGAITSSLGKDRKKKWFEENWDAAAECWACLAAGATNVFPGA